LRDPRARDGRDREWTFAIQAPRLWGEFLRIRGLCATGDAIVSADGASGDIHLHARRDGRWRGRADAPAGRTFGVLTRHPRPGYAQARRRERSRRGLSIHHAAPARTGSAGVVPAGATNAGPR